MPDNSLISASGLSKSYLEGGRRHTVLNDIDMQVRSGECIALLGRSGSGKSTLLNLLAGIDAPDAGEIHIDGQDLKRMPERQRTLFRRRRIGFVYQFYNLIASLSVRENISLPLELNGWRTTRISERTQELLELMGLAERADAFPDHLSGGEQQRVAIARALAHDPTLVLADEPTGNLDALSGRKMLELLLDITRQGGHTLVVVTHSLEVARTTDRQLVLENGRLLSGDATLAW